MNGLIKQKLGLWVCFKRLILILFQLETLEADCTAIGSLWPKLFFGSSIKPKIDVLVFVVPVFARLWGTIGGLAEDRQGCHRTL